MHNIFGLSFSHIFALVNILPAYYFYYPGVIQPVNGSSVDRFCIKPGRDLHVGMTICRDSYSSILFDGIIPTLTGLENDTWASELLTLKPRSVEQAEKPELAFTLPENHGMRRIEILMFNCPEWGISAQKIALNSNGHSVVTIIINSSLSSCDSLVRVCRPIDPPETHIDVRFSLPFGSDWVHLAKVTFYGSDAGKCPPDEVLNHPHPSPPTSPTYTGIENFTLMD